jgi:hypothetical protein
MGNVVNINLEMKSIMANNNRQMTIMTIMFEFIKDI